MVQLEVNLRQREASDARSKQGENDPLQKAHRRQAAELLAPPTAVNLLQGWRDAEEQGRRMVSGAIESARSRNLASPAPPNARSRSAKNALVATTAAQRI